MRAGAPVARGQPLEDARHIPVDDRRPRARHDRGDRPRRVPPDPRQREERGVVVDRHPPAVALDHGLRRRMQKPRAPVVPKPLPRRQHLVLARRRQRRGGRKAPDERPELLDHPRDLGLLEHQLADEGVVAVSTPPPRQVAGGGGKPRHDRLRRGGGNRLLGGHAAVLKPFLGRVLSMSHHKPISRRAELVDTGFEALFVLATSAAVG